uniref:Uncharacterized protein n=1 Tax=Zea mays TaxID=4577 RepID=B7ZYC0_MAIZE|nr:unknown [Zea mays]
MQLLGMLLVALAHFLFLLLCTLIAFLPIMNSLVVLFSFLALNVCLSFYCMSLFRHNLYHFLSMLQQ